VGGKAITQQITTMAVQTSSDKALETGVIPGSSSSNSSENRDDTGELGQPNGNYFYGSAENHIFSDSSVADYWRIKYEKAGYENLHRFDPSFEWTAEEERKLLRKVWTHLP
jgi:hypothetical protein